MASLALVVLVVVAGWVFAGFAALGAGVDGAARELRDVGGDAAATGWPSLPPPRSGSQPSSQEGCTRHTHPVDPTMRQNASTAAILAGVNRRRPRSGRASLPGGADETAKIRTAWLMFLSRCRPLSSNWSERIPRTCSRTTADVKIPPGGASD